MFTWGTTFSFLAFVGFGSEASPSTASEEAFLDFLFLEEIFRKVPYVTPRYLNS